MSLKTINKQTLTLLQKNYFTFILKRSTLTGQLEQSLAVRLQWFLSVQLVSIFPGSWNNTSEDLVSNSQASCHQIWRKFKFEALKMKKCNQLSVFLPLKEKCRKKSQTEEDQQCIYNSMTDSLWCRIQMLWASIAAAVSDTVPLECCSRRTSWKVCLSWSLLETSVLCSDPAKTQSLLFDKWAQGIYRHLSLSLYLKTLSSRVIRQHLSALTENLR